MSPAPHPSADLLARVASGALARPAALVLDAHVGACASCRTAVARFEAVGGALLEGLPPAAMAAEALEQALARLDGPEPPEPLRRALPQGVDLEAVLRDLPLGRRRWLAPGVWMRPITRERSGMAYLLRAGPGGRILEHGHAGEEYVLVLKGAFSDETGRYGPGDFVQSDERLTHQPTAERDGECLCLIFSEAPMRLRGLIGRVLQPLIGL